MRTHAHTAVGAGQIHHNELAVDVYKSERTRIYVDSWTNARAELATLDAPIAGEVGDAINAVATDAEAESADRISIFHSMGECGQQSFYLIFFFFFFTGDFARLCGVSLQ